MSQVFILYLGSLMSRSLCIGVLGFLGTLFVKSVARRHALWCAVIAAMLLMPVLDGVLPKSFIAVPIQRIATFERPGAYLPSTSLVAAPTAALSPVSRAPNTPKDLDLWTAMAALYACVTTLLLIRFAWAYCTVSHLKASSREISLSLRNEIGGPNAPSVYESEAVNVPLAGGFRSPFVLLPASWKTWDTWKLRAVLSHEFTHIRRSDPFIRMIAAINTAVYWFNPLSWLVEGMLSVLSEKASDEAAVLQNGDPARYAQVLLQFAWSAQKRGRIKLTSVAMAKHRIHSRIETILHLRSPRNGILTKAGWVTTAILALPVIYAASALQVAPAIVPRFEVASIKPCRGERQMAGHPEIQPWSNSSPGRLSTGCVRLLDTNGIGLIANAYPGLPIKGGPPWLLSAFYEINAKAEGNPSVKTMMGPMMQVLLGDRFHLKIHRETSEGPVYFLSVGRGGPKLRSFTEGSCTPYSPFESTPLQAAQKYCRGLISMVTSSAELQGGTLDEFSGQLETILERPVINKTGITGRFDIHIEFSREGTKLAAFPLIQPNGGLSTPSDPTGRPSIFTELQDQLGLKLEPGKGPVEMLIIDQLERPTEN
jgi:uncharacterized protein (TIGR03435 family)